MNRKSAMVGVVFVLGVVLSAIWFSRTAASAHEQQLAQLLKWEYKIIQPKDGPEDGPQVNEPTFNQLGAEGWELCAVHSSTRPTYCVFKRPKR